MTGRLAIQWTPAGARRARPCPETEHRCCHSIFCDFQVGACLWRNSPLGFKDDPVGKEVGTECRPKQERLRHLTPGARPHQSSDDCLLIKTARSALPDDGY